MERDPHGSRPAGEGSGPPFLGLPEGYGAVVSRGWWLGSSPAQPAQAMGPLWAPKAAQPGREISRSSLSQLALGPWLVTLGRCYGCRLQNPLGSPLPSQQGSPGGYRLREGVGHPNPSRGLILFPSFPQLLLWPHGGRPMGTPASVACDPLQRQAPEARARKRASANIFQGVGLLQLRQLFRSSGDARAEERAQLVLGYAGDRRTAQALRQLRGRQRRGRLPPQLSPAAQDSNHPRYRLGPGP